MIFDRREFYRTLQETGVPVPHFTVFDASRRMPMASEMRRRRCIMKKSVMTQPATSTRLRHNVERPRANYHRRDGRPKTPGAGRARRHESKWFQTLGLARSIALRA